MYVGVTNDIARRTFEHKNKLQEGFTAKYNATILVHAEPYPTAMDAIAREKQLKGGSRAKKIALVNKHNPTWADLFETI